MPKLDETPFEGILGNSVELRLLEHLMALPKMNFTVTELAKKAGVSRQSTSRVLKKLLRWKVLKVAGQRGNMTFYALHLASPAVRSLYLFNEALIGEIYPEYVPLRTEIRRPEININTVSTVDLISPAITMKGLTGTEELAGSMGGAVLEVIGSTGEAVSHTEPQHLPTTEEDGMGW